VNAGAKSVPIRLSISSKNALRSLIPGRVGCMKGKNKKSPHGRGGSGFSNDEIFRIQNAQVKRIYLERYYQIFDIIFILIVSPFLIFKE
jgi:hypothetical protein